MSAHSRNKSFLQTIQQLLFANKLILYGRVDEMSDMETVAVLKFFRARFEEEAMGYPGEKPTFDAAAARWSAKVLFHAAQLMMYRRHKADALADYFPDFDASITAEAMITADVCLRFLPAIIRQLEQIDVEDELIPILKDILSRWPYSGLLAYELPVPVRLRTITEDDCLMRLYVNRIIETKNEALAALPEFRPLVSAALGNYADTYWQEWKPVI